LMAEGWALELAVLGEEYQCLQPVDSVTS
jgi:hypothetical protein